MAMLTTIEGIYKNGLVRLAETPDQVTEAKVLVTFLASEAGAGEPRRMMFGQFTGAKMSSDVDFRIAEWRADPDARDGH